MARLPAGSLPGAVLAFGAGVLGVLWAPALMPWWWPGLALPVALAVPARIRWPALCALLGAVWALWHVQSTLDARWPAARHGEDVSLQGRIVGLPETRGPDRRFRFRPEAGAAVRGDIRVSWYRSEVEVAAGDCLDVTLRMRTPRGSVSPGAFDYERWLLAERLVATAYVRDAAFCTGAPPPPWTRLRQGLDTRLGAWLAGHPGLGLVRALTLANRNGIDDDDWRVLRVTGTSHLLAISGLHIGLVAGLFLFLGRWAWRRSAWLCSRLAAPRAGVLIGTMAALAYAALAGFSVPTQRALIMWAVVAAALWSARSARPFHVLALAGLAVMALDPLAVLSAGTWLSFIAVGAIMLLAGGRAAGVRAWWRIPRLQAGLLVALAPATLLFFDGASLLAPVVNALAIPLFGVLLPAVLASVVLAWSGIAVLPLAFSAEALHLVRVGLGVVAEHGADLWVQAAPSGPALLCAGLGALLVLAPQAVPLRWLGVACFLPLIWPRPGLPHGQAELALLDVGQGLATVVRTRHHTLVYDAGPAWPGGFDAGDAIVAPWLRSHGIARIDRAVLSHRHADHSGGFDALARDFDMAPVHGRGDAPPCERGMRWEWDGVRFTVLHPRDVAAWDINNVSCVLRVQAGNDTVLMPGDIERRGERRLVRTADPEQLDVDVVVAPHHGSRTSSTRAFVRATHPEIVLVGAGWRNRHGHPHGEVLHRWREAGARLHVTGHTGSLWLRLGAPDDGFRLRRARDTARIWRARPSVPVR